MWNLNLHLLIAFMFLFFSTFGVASQTNRWTKSFKDSERRWLVAPIGFVALFTLVVLLRLGEPLTRAPLAQLFLVISATYGFFKMLRLGLSPAVKFIKDTYLVLLPYIVFSVISYAVRGGLPFSVSDAWTHTSYVNRISSSRSALIVGSHLPTDGKFFSFSPTSIFLSTLNDVSGKDPIATWNASSIFFGVLLLCAATAFLVSINLLPSLQTKAVGVVSVLFIVLYPTSDLVSGWAGYSITGSIFLFIVLTLAVQFTVSKKSTSLVVIFALIGLIMSMNHQVESITGVLMMVPLFVLPQISKRHLFGLLGVFGGVSVVGALVTIRLLNPGMLVVFNFSTSWPGMKYFLNSISPFLNEELLVAAIVSVLYLWITGRSLVVAYFGACFATLLFFGPWNPIFFQIWVEIMSSTLMYRAIFALPTWILFGSFLTCLLIDIQTIRNKNVQEAVFRLGALVIVVASLGLHAAEKFGFTGQMTYYGSDKQSQLRTLPDLYNKIQGYNRKTILTDIWTGAPIPTVSSNFIVVHRPWTSGLDTNRWAMGRETMNSLSSAISRLNMCEWGVDLVMLNRAQLPLMKRQFLEAPWLLPDFYSSTARLLPSYLQEVDVIDNVHILEFDKKACSD